MSRNDQQREGHCAEAPERGLRRAQAGESPTTTRRHRCTGLAALALLGAMLTGYEGAVAAANIACSAASSEDRIWSGTIEVGTWTYDNARGYNEGQWGSLDNRTMTHDGTDYTIKGLGQAVIGSVDQTIITFDGRSPGFNPDLVLHIGDDQYELNSARTGMANSYLWVLGDKLSLAEGDTVCAAITDADPAAPPTVPGVPASLEAESGNASATLKWGWPWLDSRSPITGYQYQSRAAGGTFGTWNDVPDSAPGGAHYNSYAVTGLTNGVTYTFRVRAVNAIGHGEPSREATTTVEHVEVPAAPREPRATGTLDDGAEVELPDPANTIVGVRVETGAGAEIGSVRLTLAGAKAQARTENLAPYSLYGDDGTSPHGEGLPVGSYTLTATAYSQGNLGGAVLQTLSVSFTVAAAGETTVEEPEANALTAAFQDVPAGHNGPDRAFVFKVLFSEPIPTSYTVLRDQAFEVSAGGAVTKAKRVDGRNDLREIHVDTSTWDNVTVTLPGNRACNTTGAICMNDGRQLSNAPTATIRGPVAVTVADAKVGEGPGATLDFVVSLSREAPGTVTVDYATADGTATAGQDYTAASGTLSFADGETEKTVAVAVLDDAHDEADETMTLVLSNASGARIRDAEAVGTIENSDPIPKA